MRQVRRIPTALPAAAWVAPLAGGLVAALVLPAAAEPLPGPAPGRTELARAFVPAVAQAVPAVVSIHARRLVAGRVNPFSDDPLFGHFFRDFGRVVPREEEALGSGVIVSADGLVVSNTHVVGGAQAIRVVLADGRSFAADVVLADAASDLAVLRLIGAEDLPVLPFGNSDALEVGEVVLAIGNPFGLGQTVSMGIVSGLARSLIAVGDGRGYFIQTDAAINPGNSGGALIDAEGRLVGINTAILTRSGGSQGVGFAIPASLVAQVVAQAAAGATRFERPWAGVTAQPVDADLAEALGLAAPRGAVLTELHPASPFAAAGLRPGDVVVALGGAAVDGPQGMLFRLAAAGIGGSIGVEFLRGGAAGTAEVALRPAPEDPPRATTVLPEGSALPGLTVERVNPAVIAERLLPLSAEGVVVAAAQGWARRIGLREGDRILAINGRPVAAPEDVAALARRPEPGRWQVEVLRDGRRLALQFRL